MTSIPSQFISILMGKPHTKIEKKLQNSFCENGKFTLIWPLKGHPRSKIIRWTERPYNIYFMCFIQTLVITCTVSEILTQIDRKGQNMTFQPWKMTFRAIPYFGTALRLPQRSFFMQKKWAALRYHRLLYDNMAENEKGKIRPFRPWKVTIRAIQYKNKILQGINISTGKFHAKLQGNSSRRFGENHLWNFAIRANVKIGDLLTSKNYL